MKRSQKDKPTRLTVHNDNKAQRKKGQGTHEVHLVDTIEYQQLIERTYELLKQGMSANEIQVTLVVEGHEEVEGDSAFRDLLARAFKFAAIELHKDREYTFQLHMDRYEKIYEQSMVMEDTWHRPLDKRKDWKLITMKYVNAINALKNKENLLGLHDKKLVLEFNENKAVVLEKKKNTGNGDKLAGYDINKLTLEEKIELLSLIQEARTVPIEGIQRVVVKQIKIEINPDTGERVKSVKETKIDNTIDVEFEEMPNKIVDKFIDTTPPEVVEEESGVIVHDSRPKVEGKELRDVTQQIQNNSLEQLRARLAKNKDKKA